METSTEPESLTSIDDSLSSQKKQYSRSSFDSTHESTHGSTHDYEHYTTTHVSKHDYEHDSTTHDSTTHDSAPVEDNSEEAVPIETDTETVTERSSEEPTVTVPELTGSEKIKVKLQWTMLKRNAKDNALEIMLNFFTLYPHNQKVFKKFPDESPDKLRRNRKFHIQADIMFNSLTAIVENLDDRQTLQRLLLNLGYSHGPVPVNKGQFEEFSQSVISFLQAKLGPQEMNASALRAWTKAFDVINTVISHGLETKSHGIETKSF